MSQQEGTPATAQDNIVVPDAVNLDGQSPVGGTPNATPSEMLEIEGQRYSADQVKTALDYHNNMERWNKSNTERSEALAAERREFDARVAEFNARSGQAQGKGSATEKLPDYDDDEELAGFGQTLESRVLGQVRDLLKPVTEQINAQKQQEETQSRESLQKEFNEEIGKAAKSWGVNEDALWRAVMTDPAGHSFDYHAAKILNSGSRAPAQGTPTQPQWVQPSVNPGGTPAQGLGPQDGLQYDIDDPRAEESDRKWMQQFIKANGGG